VCCTVYPSTCFRPFLGSFFSPFPPLLSSFSTANITAVEVAGSNLIVSDRLRSLGVTSDFHLRFDCHANNVARACNYHTRALRHVRSLLTDEVAQTAVACSIVASQLDYCNALLHGAPVATIVKLQRAQNNLARVVCQRGGSTDAAPLLRSLHWLPVKHRITYKTAVLTHKVLTTSTPPHLHDMLTVAAPVFHYRFSPPPKSSPAGRIFPKEIRPRGGFLHANVSPGDFLHEKSPPGECIISTVREIFIL